MSTIPGLRYQAHSRGNKPFVIFKDKPSKPRPFYLPKTDETGQQGHGQTYRKNKAFTGNLKLYQDQIATLDIQEEEEEEEEKETGEDGGKRPDKSEERTQSEYSADTNSTNTPRMVTTIGLWSKEDDGANSEHILSYTLPSANVDDTSLEQQQQDSESLSSSRASRVVFTRNRADDEPVYFTVTKDPMESRLSIPDDEECTDNETFLSGSFIRTSDSEAQQSTEQENQPLSAPNPGLQNIENLLTSEEDIGMSGGLRDQNLHLFPSIHKLSEETGEEENNNQLRKRLGRGPVLVNKQSGAYLGKTWDKYSDGDDSQTNDEDNNTVKSIHVYPTVNVQEVDIKEKSPSHSIPTLILYHTDTESGVRLRSDVLPRQNVEYSNPALALPFHRDSPDLALGLLNRRSKSKQDIHPGTEFIPQRSSMYKIPQGKETQSMDASVDSRRSERGTDENTKSTEDEDSNADDNGNQEGMREYYHGNRGFHDSILNPPLTVDRIPNHLQQDDVNLGRRPSYILGKLPNAEL